LSLLHNGRHTGATVVAHASYNKRPCSSLAIGCWHCANKVQKVRLFGGDIMGRTEHLSAQGVTISSLALTLVHTVSIPPKMTTHILKQL